MANVPSLHPSDYHDEEGGGGDNVGRGDDTDYDPPLPILSESLSIGLRVVQITKHHPVPRHLHRIDMNVLGLTLGDLICG